MTEATKTCGACANARWALTPTGRIKRGTAGRCNKEADLLAGFLAQEAPPCLVISTPHRVAIWPDYAADKCRLFSERTTTQQP